MKNYKVGIIGTENSHANSFCKAFNLVKEDGTTEYPDFHVTLVYGDYPEFNQKLVDKFKADAIANNVEQMVEECDCAMITCRDGKFHAKYARPFIEAGKPCFVDKPFTTDVKEAVELVKLAKDKGVPLCGGSSLKYNKYVLELKKEKEEMGEKFHGGYASAPLSFENEWGGFWFYSSHLAEICLETFGWKPQAVTAIAKNKSVLAIVEYKDFAVNLEFAENCYFSYTGIITGEDKTVFKQIELDYGYRCEADVFEKVVKEGVMPHSYEELIAPVVLLDAIKRSYETGKKVEIEYPEI